jgi:hypothetical protein
MQYFILIVDGRGAGDGTTEEGGVAHMLGRGGHCVTRVGQGKVIVWGCSLDGVSMPACA